MRIRTIKPELWSNEKLSSCPEGTHYLSAALLNYADDEGYFNANPKLIQASLFPLREPSVPVADALQQLVNIGYIRLYTSKDGRCYGHIPAFADHQKINRAKDSKIKDLCKFTAQSLRNHCAITEQSLIDHCWNREQGTGNKEQGMEYIALSSCQNSAPQEPAKTGDLPLEETEHLAEHLAEHDTAFESAFGTEHGTGDICLQKQSIQKLQNTLSAPPPPPAPPPPVALDGFALARKGEEWALTVDKFNEWQEAYPFIDVLAECKRARQWLRDNPAKRKTARGMPAFLSRWLNKGMDRGSTVQRNIPLTMKPVEPVGWMAAYRRCRERYDENQKAMFDEQVARGWDHMDYTFREIIEEELAQ